MTACFEKYNSMSFTPKPVYFNVETPISFFRHASRPVLSKVVLLALPTHAVLDGLLLHRLGEPPRPFEEVALATAEHVFFVVWKSWVVVLYQTLLKKVIE
jgi:hypothetical protein